MINCQRAIDLLRYMRSELFETNLISQEEYNFLMLVPGAVQRLESYDFYVKKAQDAEQRTQELETQLKRLKQSEISPNQEMTVDLDRAHP
jgi:multidrug efflux pump subunit AcrA (membrane-fusion protein)